MIERTGSSASGLTPAGFALKEGIGKRPPAGGNPEILLLIYLFVHYWFCEIQRTLSRDQKVQEIFITI